MILSKAFAQVVLLALSSLCLTAQAKDLLAVGASFNQIFELQPNGEYTGLGVDILNRFAQQQSVNIHYQITPWRRAISMVERGQADILIGPTIPQSVKRTWLLRRKHFTAITWCSMPV